MGPRVGYLRQHSCSGDAACRMALAPVAGSHADRRRTRRAARREQPAGRRDVVSEGASALLHRCAQAFRLEQVVEGVRRSGSRRSRLELLRGRSGKVRRSARTDDVVVEGRHGQCAGDAAEMARRALSETSRPVCILVGLRRGVVNRFARRFARCIDRPAMRAIIETSEWGRDSLGSVRRGGRIDRHRAAALGNCRR
ncbi:hypothetical protein BCEN4_620016 [Burkholderia cenocepacia]|nr:hypothetical protein BCEN4_620016 [Burkholderia cenocepacia]